MDLQVSPLHAATRFGMAKHYRKNATAQQLSAVSQLVLEADLQYNNRRLEARTATMYPGLPSVQDIRIAEILNQGSDGEKSSYKVELNLVKPKKDGFLRIRKLFRDIFNISDDKKIPFTVDGDEILFTVGRLLESAKAAKPEPESSKTDKGKRSPISDFGTTDF